MCTVSVIPLLEEGSGRVIGLRLVSNRDESRHRPQALPPTWRELDEGVRAIWPVDPLTSPALGSSGAVGNGGRAGGGGTWIAANSRGVVFSILNVNIVAPDALPDQPSPNPSGAVRVSRGLIIPAVAAARDVAEAAEQVASMDLRRFAPFRLIVADASDGLRVADFRWDGQGADLTLHGSFPIAFASSGLGDRVVEGRLPLFEEMVGGEQPTPRWQDRFHHHRWEKGGRGDDDGLGWARSVLMCREAARTVSITTVTVLGDQVQMTTEPVPEPVPELVSELVQKSNSGPLSTATEVIQLRAKEKASAGRHR